MKEMDIFKEILPAVTVCDENGIVVAFNDSSEKVNGEGLEGKDLLNECHPPHVAAKLRKMMDERSTNVYTISKGNVKKLIYQTPWYRNGEFAGMVEFSLPIPDEMPHYVRGPKENAQ